MNLLIDTLPTAVEIDGKEYEINSSFRDCLRIILAWEDPELTSYEKQMIMLQLLYPQPIENTKTAIDRAIQFLNGGKIYDGEGSDSPRLYSFAKDANLIFAAFRQTHGIDLETTEMHWWKFLALFMDLGADTAYCNLVNMRKRVKDGTATKEENKAARDMGDAFDIPESDTRSLEERAQDDEFFKLVAAAQQKRDGG